MCIRDSSFSLRRIALPAFGPSLLFGIGEGAILPVIPLSARDLGASVPVAALVEMLIGIGSMVSNIPASIITMRRGERWAIVAAAVWCAIAMALCGWTDHLGVFLAASFMIGMSQAVFSLARQSYLTEAEQQRGPEGRERDAAQGERGVGGGHGREGRDAGAGRAPRGGHCPASHRTVPAAGLARGVRGSGQRNSTLPLFAEATNAAALLEWREPWQHEETGRIRGN